MDYLAIIRRESDAFLSACLDGPIDTPVPACPDWTVTDLIGHLAVVQHFHGGHLVRGVTDPPEGPRPTPPTDGLVDWFREGVNTLLDNLSSLPEDAPAWTFQRGRADVGFWRRRMAHEASIHRWDAQHARGEADGFDEDVALDGIDEYLAVFLARRPVDERPDGVSTVLADGGRRFVTSTGDEGLSAVTISGDAITLLLVLWGRLPLDQVTVTGDEDLARSVVNV